MRRERRSVVPDEGIEPPTFGLQNRCSTAELIRLSAAELSALLRRDKITVNEIALAEIV
jgi:hypothetical protein